jgi:hypothetical protein
MNDDRSPIDDELLSAVLDGEATPEERALVEASPEALARLEQLRAAAARVAEPVVPLAADVSARLLARALDEAPLATPTHAAAPVVDGPATADLPVGPVRRDELSRRRNRRRSWAGALAGVAAAVLLVVVGVSLARVGSRATSSDSASSGSAATTANGSAAADAAAPTAGGSTYATSLAQLGSLPDTATVLARFAVLEASGADFDHQFDAVSPESGANERSQATTNDVAPVPAPGTSCPVPPITPAPGESWAAAAVAQLPGGPVIVMVDRAGGAGARVLVVDAATCAVLAEGTT